MKYILLLITSLLPLQLYAANTNMATEAQESTTNSTPDNNNDRFSVDHYYVHFGTYKHFRQSDEYKGPPILGAFDVFNANNEFAGIALFNNSFSQFSQYAYVGKSWQIFDTPGWKDLHLELSGGIIHGYTGKYKNKISYNSSGFAPAIIPGIAFNNGDFGADLVIFGTAGVLVTVGKDFD